MIQKTILLMLFSTGLAWADCADSLDRMAPSSRYQELEDGTILDNKTQLVWEKCPAGGDSTTDCGFWWEFATFDFYQALDYVEAYNQNRGLEGDRRWRLANIKELQSLVDYSCSSPAMNVQIFPGDFLGSTYISSTPSRETFSSFQFVFKLETNNGSTNWAGTHETGFIRLVRDAE